MKPLRRLACCIVLAGGTPLHAQVDGRWEGAIQIQGFELGIAVAFASGNGVLSATIDIPQQNASGLALDSVWYDPPAIRFQLPSPLGTAYFDGTHERDEITGDFHQATQAATFFLRRAAPDEPSEPLPYTEEEVEFRSGDVTLAGTLTIPAGAGPFPAVVTVTGSGAQNRDEELFGFKPFAVIADHLTRHGIAVLRYDDRGVGGSTGSTTDATTADFANDALAAIGVLQDDPRLDAQAVGLLGHSEGGIVGPLAASRSDAVAFLVLLAGPAVTGAEILAQQSLLILEADGADQETLNRYLGAQRAVFQALRRNAWDEVDSIATREIAAVAESMPQAAERSAADQAAFVRAQAEQQLRRLRSPWFRFFIDYDPQPALRQTTVPILALFGGLDLQVPPAGNADVMRRVLEDAGHQDYTIEVFPTANHLFVPATTGNPSEYPDLEKVFVPGLLDLITSWIVDRTTSTP